MIRNARRIICTTAVLLATIRCGVAEAAWPSDPNVNVPVCTAASNQYYPAIASDGTGGAIVTWRDYRNSNAHPDVYAQRLDAAGVPQWIAGGVALCTATNDQISATLVSDGAGGAVITWADYRSGTADIYVQRVNAAGSLLWTAGGVALCGAVGDQTTPTIVPDGAGGAVIAWQDLRGGTTYDIYAQRVNAAGVPQWSIDGVALSTAANSQSAPTIASDGAGGAIVAWYDARSGIADDIYAQRLTATGVPQWTVGGVALCVATNDQQLPTIVSDGVGGAIVIWQDRRSGDFDIYAQRVNAVGAPQWAADGVVLSSAADSQVGPTIASDGAGGAIVTWQDRRGGTHYDIYAQRVNAGGAPQWTANGVLCSVTANQLLLAWQNSMIVSDGTGGAILTWFDYRTGNGDIYAQRVNSAGVLQWAVNGVALCTAANGQSSPTIVSDGTGGAIVTWNDDRNGPADYDIYAQDVNANGTLGGSVLSVPPISIAASFAIRGVRPNPSFGDLRVTFSLQDGTPAKIELFDLTGRRIESLSVGGLGPGAHVASLSSRATSMRPGIYSLCLTQGSRRAFSKVAIVR